MYKKISEDPVLGCRISIRLLVFVLFMVSVPLQIECADPNGLSGRLGVSVVAASTKKNSPLSTKASPFTHKKSIQAGMGKHYPAGTGFRMGGWNTYGVADGLPPASIGAMVQDDDGRLWLGTGRLVGEFEAGDGVICYDGANFINFTTEDGLASNTVIAIATDLEGHLWFSTWGAGISHYDGSNFTNFDVEDGLLSNNVNAIAVDKSNNIWFASDVGISRFDGHEFTRFTSQDGLINNKVRNIAVDGAGNIWFSSGSGVSRYDGREFINYTQAEGLLSNDIEAMSADNNGHIWFAGAAGINRFDGEGIKPVLKEIFPETILSLAVDSDGRVWMGSFGDGVWCFAKDRLYQYSTKDGLGIDIIPAILIDRNDNAWFGNLGGGLSRYEKNVFTLTVKDGLPHNQVFSVFENNHGQVWVASRNGTGFYRDANFEIFARDKFFWPLLFADNAGRMYLQNRHGLVYPKEKRGRTLIPSETFVGGQAIAFLESQKGNYWIGTDGGGLIYYDDNEVITYTTKEGLASNWITSLAEDNQGNLWIGTGSPQQQGSGIMCFDGQEFVRYSTENGLPHNNVRSVLIDKKGQVWAGTWGGGVSRYDGQKWTTFTTADGLSHDRVITLLEDNRGILWIGTWGGGVTVYDGMLFQKLLKADGLGHNAVQDLSLGQHGAVWIATEGGVTRYRPYLDEPLVRLTSIAGDRINKSGEEFRFSSDKDKISFSFQGASLHTDRDRFVYMYRLRGVSDDWQQTRHRTVEFTDLALGQYTFEVKAIDRDLNYTKNPATATIIIHPPYGQIILIGGLALSLVALFIVSVIAVRKRRAHYLEQQQRIRAQEYSLDQERALRQRMQQELEEARALQLSMLPLEKPEHPSIEVAWRMETATEVGGDYYDYYLDQDGVLSVIIGDATGHGMNAGTLVSATKSLFINLCVEQNITEILATMSRSLKRMNLKRIGMALSIVRIKDYSMEVSSAGIPPLFIYNAAKKTNQEILIQGLPLGFSAHAQYEKQTIPLAGGDVVLLMSDGLPERLNSRQEQFGYQRIASLLVGLAHQPAEEIIHSLLQSGDEWAGNRLQDDDITLVVLKVKK